MIPLLLLSLAYGQGFDGHQLDVAAYDGDIRDPMRVQRPGRFHQRDWFVGGIVEGSQGHVVRYTDDGETVDEQAWLTDVVALNLSGGVAAHDRLRFDIAAPVFLSSRGLDGPNGAAFGDLRLTAMGSLLRPRRHDLGVGLGLTAHLDLPTGASAKLLGQRTIAGGGALSWTYGTRRVTPTVEVGVQFNPTIETHNLRGADAFTGGAGLAITPRDDLGITLEGRWSVPFTRLEPRGTETLAETQLSVRYHHRGGGHLLFGGAAGLSAGAGSPVWRAFIGGGFGKVHEEPDEPDTTSLEVDAERSDGGPVSGTDLVLTPAEQSPIERRLDEGPVVLTHLQAGIPWHGRAQLGCFAGDADITLGLEHNRMNIEMSPTRDTTVIVEVISAGKPVENASATWQASPGCVESAQMLLEAGQGEQLVGEGLHTLFITAPGLGLVEAEVDAPPEGEVHLVVELEPTRVDVTEQEVVILEPVHFAFDQWVIDPRSYPLLDEVAATLNLHDLTVAVEGHTDAIGSESYNQQLSERRMDSVVAYLADKGVELDRLHPKGFGESQPIDRNDTDAGRARNRRVVFRILER